MKEIYELSSGVEYHMRELEKVIPALRDVKESLDQLKRSREGEFLWQIHLLKEEVGDLKNHLRRYGLQEADKYETELKALKGEIESSRWPSAVEPGTICDTEEKLQSRADGILNLVIGEELKDKTFLDFGCGRGHVVAAAKEKGAQAIGYDISPCELPEGLFSEDFDKIREHGPYEIVLLHDVLDHIEKVDPITALQQVRAVTNHNSRIYVRNHPWCSSHGGHVYEHINKSFIHLVLDDVELTRLCGCQADYNIKVTQPFETYRHWFSSVGFEIKSEIPIRKPVEAFFLDPSHVHKRLSEKWEDTTEMIKDMEIEFIEYVLGNPNISPDII